jgi:hypothetical protein
MSIRYLSAEAGMADEYANMTRTCPKLIHPSVFPVLAGAGKGPLPLLRPRLDILSLGRALSAWALR